MDCLDAALLLKEVCRGAAAWDWRLEGRAAIVYEESSRFG